MQKPTEEREDEVQIVTDELREIIENNLMKPPSDEVTIRANEIIASLKNMGFLVRTSVILDVPTMKFRTIIKLKYLN